MTIYTNRKKSPADYFLFFFFFFFCGQCLLMKTSERDREGKKQREPQSKKKSGAYKLHGLVVRSKDVVPFDTQNHHHQNLLYLLLFPPISLTPQLEHQPKLFLLFFCSQLSLHLSSRPRKETQVSFVSSSDIQDEDTV